MFTDVAEPESLHATTCMWRRGPCLTSFSHPGYRFEDGTIPFLDVIALKHGFDALERLTGRGTLLSRGICSRSPRPPGSPARGNSEEGEWVRDRHTAAVQ